MSDSELVVLAPQSFQAPGLIERAGPSTRKKFFEFFTVPIRNANTRAAYYRAIQQFLAWVERAGYQDLEDIEPITVAAYIETLQRQVCNLGWSGPVSRAAKRSWIRLVRKNPHRSSDSDSFEEHSRFVLWHPDATMACGVTRQVTRVHAERLST